MKPGATILAVDDTPTNLDILVDLLAGYDVAVAIDGKSALALAEANPVDLILLDIMLPDIDGFAVCSQLKADPKTRDIPIIFITAKNDETSIENAYDAGGDDYVTKPFKPREVLARVRLQLERAEHLKQLEYYATRDPMTGLYNRRKFFELAQACFMQKDGGLTVGAILDIDHFKRINDTYGHPAGDAVIRRIGRTVAALLPETAVFGRIGGEEFGIVGRFDDRETAMRLFERCRADVEALEIAYADETIRCTISNGMACKSDRIDTLDKLLAEADRALYEAKGDGRNRLIVRT